jgi:hypothetical protein
MSDAAHAKALEIAERMALERNKGSRRCLDPIDIGTLAAEILNAMSGTLREDGREADG